MMRAVVILVAVVASIALQYGVPVDVMACLDSVDEEGARPAENLFDEIRRQRCTRFNRRGVERQQASASRAGYQSVVNQSKTGKAKGRVTP